MKKETILSLLPYEKPFLFVDSIETISESGIVGYYQFREDEYFYKGHFKEHPVTPGVILIECMAQIGLVCLGIYLNRVNAEEEATIVLSETNIQFLKGVTPNEKMQVVSEKLYFRFGKLKCNVKMFNKQQEKVAEGTLSGMILST